MTNKNKRHLRLLVDVTSLHPPLTGIGRYTFEILSCLAQNTGEVELHGLSDHRHYEPAALNDLLATVDGSQLLTDRPQGVSPSSAPFKAERAWPLAKKVIRKIPGARRVRASLQSKRLARAARQFKGSIHWQPNFILGEANGPSMVTVYDLSHVRYSHFHPPERLRWLERGLPSTLDRAERIMTVSEFSKAEIIDVYGVAAEQIRVVYPGVSDSFHHCYSTEELALIRKRYNLPSQYLLSLGTLEPRKNLKGLIQAYACLSPALRQQFPLVLVGGQGWNHGETDALIARLESRSELLKLGYVPQAVLPQLYQNASAFAYASIYEGFGMPVAEAMASGVPVITSNCASMPEVANDCAELVDPHDIDSISKGLNNLLGDLCAATQRCEAARLVSNDYSWEKAANCLLDVASELHENH